VYEAMITGTPVVAIPLFGDQGSNAAFLRRRKVSVTLELDTVTKESILASLNTIINDTGYTFLTEFPRRIFVEANNDDNFLRYYQRMQELSSVFKDRPMSPQESIVYWTEYVIRHNGASHLKALGTDMPLYKYLMLDIFSLLFIAVAVVVLVMYILFRKIRTWVKRKLRYAILSKKQK